MRKLVDQFGLEYVIPEIEGKLSVGRNSGCNVVIPPVSARQNPDFYTLLSSSPEVREKAKNRYGGVSRIHATIFTDNGKTFISDGSAFGMGNERSSNGTFVDHVSVNATHPGELRSGSIVHLGKLRLTYGEGK